MQNATIFALDAARIKEEPDCFDVRFDTQAIPGGAVVYGFMSGESQVLSPPPMTPEQKEEWNKAIQYANNVLDGEE